MASVSRVSPSTENPIPFDEIFALKCAVRNAIAQTEPDLSHETERTLGNIRDEVRTLCDEIRSQDDASSRPTADIQPQTEPETAFESPPERLHLLRITSAFINALIDIGYLTPNTRFHRLLRAANGSSSVCRDGATLIYGPQMKSQDIRQSFINGKIAETGINIYSQGYDITCGTPATHWDFFVEDRNAFARFLYHCKQNGIDIDEIVKATGIEPARINTSLATLDESTLTIDEARRILTDLRTEIFTQLCATADALLDETVFSFEPARRSFIPDDEKRAAMMNSRVFSGRGHEFQKIICKAVEKRESYRDGTKKPWVVPLRELPAKLKANPSALCDRYNKERTAYLESGEVVFPNTVRLTTTQVTAETFPRFVTLDCDEDTRRIVLRMTARTLGLPADTYFDPPIRL